MPVDKAERFVKFTEGSFLHSLSQTDLHEPEKTKQLLVLGSIQHLCWHNLIYLYAFKGLERLFSRTLAQTQSHYHTQVEITGRLYL